MFCVSAFDAVYSACRTARPLAIAAAALWLGGCSVSMPLGPIFGANDDVTGSIPARDGRFSDAMTDEDWAQARGAVQAAMDPRGAGTAQAWTGRTGGMKGSVAPVSAAYAASDRTCRAFIATLVEGAETRWFQGSACQAPNAGWTVVSTAPWQAPAAPSTAVSPPA